MAKYKITKFAKTKLKINNPVLVGEYNKYNIGAVEAVARVLRVEKYVSLAVENFKGVPGRMEEVKLGQKFRVIVDFAHTPNALEQVLRELKTQKAKGKKVILVFGCASERDTSKRPIMGQIAKRLADKVIVTAEDPRRESLDNIFREITSGEDGFVRMDERDKAIKLAVSMAKAGDIVVITGKGHEKSMNIGGVEYPWSDRKAVEKAISKLLLFRSRG